MRILFITGQPFVVATGSSLRLRHLALAATDAGHEVDLICGRGGAPCAAPRLRILATPAFGRRTGARALALGLRRRLAYDAMVVAEDAAAIGALLRRIFRWPMIYAPDGCLSDGPGDAGFRLRHPGGACAAYAGRAALRAADVILTSGPCASEDVRARFPDARIEQIEDTPLLEVYRPDPAAARRLRSAWGLGDAPAVLYIGRLGSDQGIDLLFHAARAVLARRPEVRFVLAGGNPAAVQRARRMVRGLDIERAVVLAGPRPIEDTSVLLTLADALVSPRVRDRRISHKLYTYLQSGKPIVATRLAMHTQTLDDACAILTAPTSDALAAGLLQALNEPLLAAALGREAQSRVATRYNPATFRRKARTLFAGIARRGEIAP